MTSQVIQSSEDVDKPSWVSTCKTIENGKYFRIPLQDAKKTNFPMCPLVSPKGHVLKPGTPEHRNTAEHWNSQKTPEHRL